jgi:hypothetical protein
LREQPWFCGVLATWGASYLGIAQWELAARDIPEWKIAVIQDAPLEFVYQFMYPRGGSALDNALGWVQIVDRMFRADRRPARQLFGVFSGPKSMRRGLLTLAGPVDLDELDRWVRIGWEHAGVRWGAASTARAAAGYSPGRHPRPGPQSARRDSTGQPGPLVSKEIQLRGTFRFNDEIDTAITLLDQNPQIEQVVTHVLPLENINDAFAIAANSEISGKVLVEVSAS